LSVNVSISQEVAQTKLLPTSLSMLKNNWNIVLDSVKKYQDVGVNMHILGLGVQKNFF